MAALIDTTQLNSVRRKAVVLCASMGTNVPTEGIPGSWLADLEADFSDPNAPYKYTIPENIQEVFASYGISENTPVVIYDVHPRVGVPSARIWWLVKIAGIKNVAVLNGGIGAWTAEGRSLGPISTLDGERPETGSFEAGPEWERLADADDVVEAATMPNTRIVDVRGVTQYTGEETAGPVRGGHIPTAVNLPAGAFFDGAKMKDPDGLRDALETVVGPSDALVFTCHAAIAACVGALAANVAGFGDVRVYEGSWMEWGDLDRSPDDFPVVTGTEPGEWPAA
ncbi:sulfurtransferase [Corynebacterium renale]|uniref:sulfurtransferase n=1 Tax=Corynebacterium renale TaxID=1724 RepID=UPI000654500D|nr:rhodanese-like domain-containing protein [Corynebacterium renale]